MSPDLIEKGKKIIDELNLKREETLEKWMAHYIAELMEKAESVNSEEATKAKKQCADITSRLWDMRLRAQEMQIQQKLDANDDLLLKIDADATTMLREMIRDPEKITSYADYDPLTILLLLNQMEQKLIRILSVSKILATTPTEEEAGRSFDEIIFEDIAKIFPPLEDLSLSDFATLNKEIIAAMRSVNELRQMMMKFQ